MRHLFGNKSVEGVDDALNVDAQIEEGGLDLLPGERSVVAERYREQKFLIHVHCRDIGIHESEVGAVIDLHEYCATFNSACRANRMGVQPDSRHQLGNIESDGVRRPTRNMDGSMLVDVVHLTKNPEGITFHCDIPSVIRLQSLDDCLRFWRDAPDLVKRLPFSATPSVERVALIADRESGRIVIREFSGIASIRDGVNDVVQGRPEVVNDIPNNCAPVQERGVALEYNSSPKNGPDWRIRRSRDLPYNLGIVDDLVTVWFKEGSQRRIQRIQV